MNDIMNDADSPSTSTFRAQQQQQSTKSKYGILANVQDEELKTIHVTIRRKGFVNSGNLSPIRRHLDDPRLLKVHINGKNLPNACRPIFDRSDVKVNRIECLHSCSGHTSSMVSKWVRSRSSSSVSTDSGSHYKPKQIKQIDNIPSTSKSYTSSRNERNRSSTSPSERYRKYNRERRSPSYTSKQHKCNCGLSATNRRSRSRSRSDSERKYNYKVQHQQEREHERSTSSSQKKYSTRRSRSKSITKRRKHSRSRSPISHRRRESSPPSSSHHHRRKSKELSPLRPGEYRPGYPRPPSRSRSKSPPDYRRRNHSPHLPPHRNSYNNPYDHHPHNMGMRPPYMPPFMPRGMVQPQQIFIPYMLPPPQMPPLRHPQWIRPTKKYNNRPMPNFLSLNNSTGTNSSGSTTLSSGTNERQNQSVEEDKDNLASTSQ